MEEEVSLAKHQGCPKFSIHLSLKPKIFRSGIECNKKPKPDLKSPKN